MRIIIPAGALGPAPRAQEALTQGDLVSSKRLEELQPQHFSSILILADECGSTVDADSRSLAVQLLLRDIQVP